MDASDYHRVLGTTPDDNEEYITSRYKELSLVWHPDKCGKHDICTDSRRQMYTERQREINEAYSALKSDLRKRHGRSSKQSAFTNIYEDLKVHFTKLEDFDTPTIVVGVLVFMIGSYALIKAVPKIGKIIISSNLNYTSLAMVVIAATLNIIMYNSEYQDLAFYVTIPIFLSVAISILYSIWTFCVAIWRWLWRFSVCILLALIAGILFHNPTGIMFPKVGAVTLLFAMFSVRDVLGSSVMIIFAVACFYYTSSNSDDYQRIDNRPFAEFTAELEVLYLYLIMFLFGYLGGSPEVQQTTISLSACIQNGNCSQRYIDQLVAFLKHYAYSNWTSLFIDNAKYIPVVIVLWRLSIMVSDVISRLGTLFSPLNEDPSDATSSPPTRPAVRHIDISKEDECAIIYQLVDAIPNLHPDDARSYLQTAGWDFDATHAYLLSASGKASLAALRRAKHCTASGTNGKNSNCNVKQEKYPPVEATDRTVLPKVRRINEKIGSTSLFHSSDSRDDTPEIIPEIKKDDTKMKSRQKFTLHM